MHWLIQNNLKSADTRDAALMENIIRLGVKHTRVNVFPFVEKIFAETVTSSEIDTAEELNFDNATDVVINGSVTFSRLAYNRNIRPGAFLTDNSDFPVILKGYGADNLLNGDAVYGKLKDMEVPDTDRYYFIRPVKDSKVFSGMELHGLQFVNWKSGLLTISTEDSLLSGETEIVIASVKEIYKEFRFFVCDGKIVTYSLYKEGNRVQPHIEINEEVEAFVKDMIALWTPHIAYVIDIAITPYGNKIVELNAFGSSGFYKCDTQKIIMAVESLEYDQKI
jgi:hypothetical protein